MIKAIIVEDESYIRKGLITLIESINQDIIIVAECGTIKEAETVIAACKPNLVLLDINLPDGTAFDLLEKLKTISFQLIFITAYNEYALRALKAGALDYILKPVDPEELAEALQKVEKAFITSSDEKAEYPSQKKDRLVVSLQEGLQIIRLAELKYCTSDKGYTTFYLEKGKSILASKPLKFFEESLPKTQFIRVHQSSFVNLDFIDRYNKTGVVVLKSGEEITVSNRKKEEVIACLLDR